MSVNRKFLKEGFEFSLNHGVDAKSHAKLMEASVRVISREWDT